MKVKIVTGLILISLVIFQSTLINYFRIFSTKPDLVYATVIIISLSFELKWVMIFSYCGAILLDSLSGLPFGFNTLVLPLLAFLIYRLSRKIDIEGNYMKAAIIAVAMLAKSIAFLFLFLISGLNISAGIFLKFMIIGCLYTTLIFLLLVKINRLSLILQHL